MENRDQASRGKSVSLTFLDSRGCLHSLAHGPISLTSASVCTAFFLIIFPLLSIKTLVNTLDTIIFSSQNS